MWPGGGVPVEIKKGGWKLNLEAKTASNCSEHSRKGWNPGDTLVPNWRDWEHGGTTRGSGQEEGNRFEGN